jgi:hypothetical protein
MVDGPGLRLCFQLTDARRPNDNRLHLDLESRSRSNEVERLTALGATTVAGFDSHTWLQDPEGNNFCIADSR